MDVLTIVGGVFLVGAALALILYPLRQRPGLLPDVIDPTDQPLNDAETRYQAALDSIKELMFDYELGRVDAIDYESLLAKTKLEAAQIRRRIDHLTQQITLDPALDAEIEGQVTQLKNNLPTKNKALAAEVEAEIERLKQIGGPQSAPLTCQDCGRQLPAEAAFCSGCGQAVSQPPVASAEPVTQCPSCGYAIQADDAFCAHCGLALSQPNLQTIPEASR